MLRNLWLWLGPRLDWLWKYLELQDIYCMLNIVNVVGTFGQNICGRIKSFEILERYSGSIHVTWTLKVDRVRERKISTKGLFQAFPSFILHLLRCNKMCDWTCNGPLIVHFHTKVKRLSEQISRGRMEWPTFLFHVKIPFVSPTGNTVTFCKFTFTTKYEVWNKKQNRKDERSFECSRIKFMNGFECST